MTETPALGDLIRERRLALGYSLGQLATKVGRTAATVRTWERGEAVPNEESRAALESVLYIDPGELESLLPSARPELAELEDDSYAQPFEDGIPADGGDADEAETVAAAELDVDANGDSEDEESEPQAVEPESSNDESEPAAVVGAVAAAATTAVVETEVVASADGEALDEPGKDVEPDRSVQEPEGVEAADAALSDEELDAGGAPSETGAESHDGEPALPVVPLATEAVPSVDEEVPPGDSDDSDDTLEGVAAVTPFEVDPALIDEPTEAVVVPVVAAATGVATQTRSVVTVSEPREQRSRNPVRAFFDPQSRWLYWVRALLTLAVVVVLAFVLVWAAGELFDALGQVLDSIEPTELDDGGIDALGRLRTLT